MRFDSPEHLEAWRDRGEWPAIHVPMVNMAVEMLVGQRLVDLGCSYGLLGARLKDAMGLEAVLGIDADEDTMDAASEAGMPVKFVALLVERHTLPDLIREVGLFKADCMVCRRILPELFGDDLELGRTFGAAMVGCGVTEMLIQGRVDSARSKNPLHNVEAEIEMLAASYKLVRLSGSVAYLRAR